MNIYKNMPATKEWVSFIEKLFLILAGLTFVSSVVFFIAYNWDELGRFFKFILIEGLMVLSIAIALYVKSALISEISLFVASFLVGVFMALFGQVYQTQADSWELFFYWALLISPWVFVSRFIANWLLWILLLEVAVWLYSSHYYRFGLGYGVFLKLFILNAVFLILWEYISKKLDIKYAFVAHKLLLSMSTFSVIALLFNRDVSLWVFVWIGWIGFIYYFYRHISVSIYALSTMSLSVVVGVDILLVRLFDKMHVNEFIGMAFVIGVVTISLGTLLAQWLKKVAKEDANATK